MGTGSTWWGRSLLVFVVSLLAFDLRLSPRPQADEVPATIEVTAYFWTAPNRAHLLLRVPLSGLLSAPLPREGPGYLALDHVGPALRETAQALAAAIDFYQGNSRLGTLEVRAARISLPLDQGFDSYASALSLVTGPPLPSGTQVFWPQGFADFWLSYPVAPAPSGPYSAQFRLMPLVPTVTTRLHVAESHGGWADYRFDNDVGRVWFEPSALRAAWTFASLGVSDAVRDPRLLLLLVCLVLAGPTWIGLRRPVTAGAVGLSAPLLASTLLGATGWRIVGLDVLLGAAIIIVALQSTGRVPAAGRWWIVGAAGLLLGARFAANLDPRLQYAGAHPATAAVAFTVGIQTAAAVVLIVFMAVSRRLGRGSRALSVSSAPDRSGGGQSAITGE